MANHVYFNIEIDGLTEEQHNCLFKTEINSRPHWNEDEPPIDYEELVEIHEQPFMSNVERTYDKDGWIENSYGWYCDNVGAKWCNIDEWGHGYITGYSAWSTPYRMVENMLEYASQRFNVELSAKMTYEDEFRNFIGRDFFETTLNEEGTWYCLHDEEYIDGNELNDLLEENLGCDVSDGDFEWFDVYKDTGKVPSECVDEMVYNFFDTGELHWVN